MIVVLDDERLESPLPNVPAGTVVAVIASGVGHEQPLHPSAQVAVSLGTHQQVTTIRYQTVPEHIHGKPSAGVDDGLDEGVLVAGLMEDGLAAVAAVEHVIQHAANRGSGSSWHAKIAMKDLFIIIILYVNLLYVYVPFCLLQSVLFVRIIIL